MVDVRIRVTHRSGVPAVIIAQLHLVTDVLHHLLLSGQSVRSPSKAWQARSCEAIHAYDTHDCSTGKYQVARKHAPYGTLGHVAPCTHVRSAYRNDDPCRGGALPRAVSNGRVMADRNAPATKQAIDGLRVLLMCPQTRLNQDADVCA